MVVVVAGTGSLEEGGGRGERGKTGEVGEALDGTCRGNEGEGRDALNGVGVQCTIERI